MLLDKAVQVLKEPKRLVLRLDYWGLLSWLPTELYEKLVYPAITGQNIDLKNPETFNEKIIWLKLYWLQDDLKNNADKYLVREFLQQKGLSHLLNRLYAVYESVDEIDIQKLPESFVLKLTTGSGWNIICRNKNEMDWKLELQKLREWMKSDYYKSHREWVYKGVKPRIVCEELLQDENGRVPYDYKISCFDGEPRLIQLDIDRFDKHRRNFYDTDWNFYPHVQYGIPNAPEMIIEKPPQLQQMLDYCRILSKGVPYARIDLYDIQGKVIFGEITYFPCAGYTLFKPREFGLYVGSMIKLPSRT